MLEEDGVLEAMDHLENAIERIKDVHKMLKKKIIRREYETNRYT